MSAGTEGPPGEEATRWLDADEQRAWRRLLAMSSELRRVLGRELQRATGLSFADYAVLVQLSEAPEGTLRPSELGTAVEWEKSRLSHHLTRMEARGLVSRRVCQSDSRGAFVSLTPAGQSAIEAAAPVHVEQVRRRFLSAITSDQLAELTAIAEAVLAKLAPCAADGGDGHECQPGEG